MKIDQFPPQYEAQRKLKAANDVAAERKRSDSRRESIRNSISKSDDILELISKLPLAIGIVVGFFPCCSKCDGLNNTIAHGLNTMVDGLAAWLTYIFFGFIFTLILSIPHGFISDKKREKGNIELANEQSRCEQAIQEINTQAAREIAVYKSEFETEARQMSVRYAESSLATEIIDRLTNSFASAIVAADRRSHITTIDVPFSFNVYTNKITCSSATYDFETKRYSNLTGPLEQTAIARAIAAAVQLNITMKYPHDISGTDFKLDISYTYVEDHVSASITYTAPNGNYRSVQSW